MKQATDLLNFDLKGLREHLQTIGEASFRATQIFKWIHQGLVGDFDEMTNLSKTLRAKLKDSSYVSFLEPMVDHLSRDGTRKWLYRLDDGNSIETVYIPENDRGTLCVSSQVGCALNCTFCATATQGFNRNLTIGEIIAQVRQAVMALKKDEKKRPVTNVVMMGMGEPLLNYDNVLRAMNIMMDDNAYGLSKYRVTLSTSGVVPKLVQLAKESEVALAISLHAPNDTLRDQIVPINKKYPLKVLLGAMRNHFPKGSKRKITVEYVMLDGVNDTKQHARELIRCLAGIPVKINLIPFNPFPTARYRCSSTKAIGQFRDILVEAGLITTVRKTRGDDIAAACGQLVGDFTDRTSRSRRYQEQLQTAQ